MIFVVESAGYPGNTTKITVSDTATQIDSNLVTRNGQPAVGLFVTCEDNDVRVTWGGTDPSTTLGHLLVTGQSLKLNNEEAIRNFKYINKSAGSNGTLMVTPEFNQPEV